jgi:predicted ArsR family transcriptional regulator
MSVPMSDSPVASEPLSSINERRVLEFVQRNGPASRAVMARGSGMSAPTVSKAVVSLIRNGFLEETEASEVGFGRPGKLLQRSAMAMSNFHDHQFNHLD